MEQADHKKPRKVIPAVLLMLSFVFSLTAYAKDLGRVGQIYPIKEMDIVDFIHSRLKQMQQSGELTKINKQIMSIFKKRAEHPEPVKGITTTKKDRSWLVDPSITFEHDILDAKGRAIVKKRTTINPLKNVSLKKAYVFYDGDNKSQVTWVIKKDEQLQGKDKLILVKGSVVDQSNILKKRIYFDQHGKLTSKFKIKCTPAVVTQEGMQFRVEELVP